MPSKFGGVPVEQPTSKFGGVPVDTPVEDSVKPVADESLRAQALKDLAEDTSFGEALMVGMGRGFMAIPRGLGLAEKEDPLTKESMAALSEESPVAFGAGEIVGEVAPFVAPGLGIGGLATIPARVAAGTALGATEGAILAEAKDKDVAKGAGIGAAIGGGAEILFPIIGRIGRSIFQRVRGKPPTGTLIDSAGNPTQEFKQVLDEAGMTMDDLTGDAVDYLKKQTGADPEQAARAARFTSEGVPVTKGEMTQEFGQQATEQRLLGSAADPVADEFRQFKLAQSDAVRESLEKSIDTDALPEATGSAMIDALTNRKNLLRTQKNELYKEASEAAKDAGGIPLFNGGMSDAVPDADTLEDLAITAPQAIKSLDQLLTKYGIKEPTQEAIEQGFKPKPITLDNFERIRKSLNAIERGDQTGAAAVAIRPIRNALDSEVDNLAETVVDAGLGSTVVKPLKEARSIVREMKTEFSPQSLAGQLIETKRDGVTPIIEASRAYNKLIGKAQPVENVRKVMSSLKKGGADGAASIADIQATTVMDLIDAGFGTASRKIDGVPVFNPNAFNKRLNAIGKDKLSSIFGGNRKLLNKLGNIEKIATDMIPPAGTVPKGSASVILDLMDKLGVVSITQNVPGGGILVEQVRRLAESGSTRKAVQEAVEATPEMLKTRKVIENELPGLSTALGIGIMSQEGNQ